MAKRLLILLGCCFFIQAFSQSCPPQDLKALYQDRCSSCHSINKSNYSQNVLPSYWEDCIRRMAIMPNSNISNLEEILLYEYIVYYTATRRKKQLEQQLSYLPPEQCEMEKNRLRKVICKFN